MVVEWWWVDAQSPQDDDTHGKAVKEQRATLRHGPLINPSLVAPRTSTLYLWHSANACMCHKDVGVDEDASAMHWGNQTTIQEGRGAQREKEKKEKGLSDRAAE